MSSVNDKQTQHTREWFESAAILLLQLLGYIVYKHGTDHEGTKQHQHFLRKDTLSGTRARHDTSSTPGAFGPCEHAQSPEKIQT